MTDEPHLPRFLIRRGARHDWMVWDRHTKGPAMFQGHPLQDWPKSKRAQSKMTKRYIPRGQII
jgi:hypothetical protein